MNIKNLNNFHKNEKSKELFCAECQRPAWRLSPLLLNTMRTGAISTLLARLNCLPVRTQRFARMVGWIAGCLAGLAGSSLAALL